MGKELTEKQIAAREKFYADRGKWKWNDTWQTMLELNEDVLSAYSTMSSIAHKKSYLTAREKELVYCAIDGAITQLYIPGMINHIRHAVLDVGVTGEELMEAFVIASSIGAAAFTETVPILVEELGRRGMDIPFAALTEEQEALKKRFVAKYGWWSYKMDSILKLDRDMFAAYLDYIEASEHGALTERERELVYIGVNASPTSLNNENTAIHIRKALDLGVTAEEIMEVLELVSCLGIHTVLVGIPALKDAMEERDRRG